jgi:hypothetical protein
MSWKIRHLSVLEKDHFTAPVIDSWSSHLLIEVDLSPHETQVFLVDESSNTLYAENYYWVDWQLRMVQSVINDAMNGRIHISHLENKTILLGVWHFGHFIGDHIHRLICSSCEDKGGLAHTLHVSSNQAFIQQLSALLVINSSVRRDDKLREEAQLKPRRIYRLRDCRCIFPAINKSVPLATAQVFLSKMHFSRQCYGQPRKILLTSGRKSRIANIDEIVRKAVNAGWLVLNPSVTPLYLLLNLVSYSEKLVSENGSILFNCFISRVRPYDILASTRSLNLSEKEWAGGGIYNEFHKSLAIYHYFKPIREAHHPYSDQIYVPLDSFQSILSLP